MALRFKILGSSSSGNVSLLVTERCKILIDAGFSGRKICQLLEEAGESADAIDAVFLTHEHSDHTAGLKGLSRRRPLRVFANRDTAQAVQSGIGRPLDWQVFETGGTFTFRDLEVTSFSVPHDAYDPVGFVFSSGGEDLFNPRRSVAWATDLGYVPQLVGERVRRADVLVLEANHDHGLLEQDLRRPWSVKQRIRGRHGHLSNTDALSFLESVANPSWEHVYLAHLSRDCNDVALVEELFGAGRANGRSYQLSVVDPHLSTSPTYESGGF